MSCRQIHHSHSFQRQLPHLADGSHLQIRREATPHRFDPWRLPQDVPWRRQRQTWRGRGAGTQGNVSACQHSDHSRSNMPYLLDCGSVSLTDFLLSLCWLLFFKLFLQICKKDYFQKSKQFHNSSSWISWILIQNSNWEKLFFVSENSAPQKLFLRWLMPRYSTVRDTS